MVVPIHWIQGDTLMYPPKGKVVGEFVRKLTPVDKLTWRHYMILKIIKEKASLAECNKIFNQPDSTNTDMCSDEDVESSRK